MSICSLCNKSFKTEISLCKHIEKCKSNSHHSCEFCSKVYSTIYNLNKHKNKCKVKLQNDYKILEEKYKAVNEKTSKLECIEKMYEQIELKTKKLEEENTELKKTIFKLQVEYDVEKKYINEYKENYKENYKELLSKVNSTTHINNINNANNNNNITLKQVVSKLEPISYEEIKDSMTLFTNEYVDDGILGFARFLCDHSCNNKIITTDKSRNTIAYRTKLNDFIKDPECLILINKTLQDNSDEIIRKSVNRIEYYKELLDTDDEFDTYFKRGSKILDLKKLTESSLKEKPDENIKKISNHLCTHGVRNYQNAIDKIKE
jgi:hypothetical protein